MFEANAKIKAKASSHRGQGQGQGQYLQPTNDQRRHEVTESVLEVQSSVKDISSFQQNAVRQIIHSISLCGSQNLCMQSQRGKTSNHESTGHLYQTGTM